MLVERTFLCELRPVGGDQDRRLADVPLSAGDPLSISRGAGESNLQELGGARQRAMWAVLIGVRRIGRFQMAWRQAGSVRAEWQRSGKSRFRRHQQRTCIRAGSGSSSEAIRHGADRVQAVTFCR